MTRVAFQMEELARCNPATNNTLLLMREALDRRFEVFAYQPHQLSWRNNTLFARAQQVTHLWLEKPEFYKQKQETALDLSTIDVLHIRQDPPFNMEYITATYLLERIAEKTLMVNHPAGVRNSVEKLLPLAFPEFIPPTLISKDPAEVEHFYKEHRDIVIKPLYGFHGFGVWRFSSNDTNFHTYLEQLPFAAEPMVIQPFLAAIKQGNKRIVMFDGEIAGALNTVPGTDEFRIYRQSTDHAYELTKRDREICEALAPTLKKRGLIFAGIDIIGDYLIEVNVTSPGSLVRLNHLYKEKFESALWDKILTKIHA